MAPKKKRENTFAADPGKSWFVQEELIEGDIPILPVDVHGGGPYLLQILQILKQREIVLSPFLIALEDYVVHCTPLSNPLINQRRLLEDKESTKTSSHHILQLYSSRLRSYKVDLLAEDTTLYYKGFRRHVRRRRAVKGGAQLGPGTWCIFKDLWESTPKFIRKNAIKIDMHCSYDSPVPEVGGRLDFAHRPVVQVGGSLDFTRSILHELITFEILREESPSFRNAMYALMTQYFEVRRSLGMQLMILKRIKNRLRPRPLPALQNATKTMWGSFSYQVQEAKRDGPKSLCAEKKLPEYFHNGDLIFETLEDLIGKDGELLIVKLDERMLRNHVTEQWFLEEAEKATRARKSSNPKFITPPNFVPRWLREDWSTEAQASLGFLFEE
ncbi:unnamed protein product [Urochloa humidicola]